MKSQGLHQSYGIPQHSLVACCALDPKADIGGRQNMPTRSCLVSRIPLRGLRFSGQWSYHCPSVPREQNRIPQSLNHILSFCGSTPNHSAPSWAWGLWYVTRPYNSDLASQEVLKKVSPYHCLGYIWSQVDKVGKKHLTSTIDAVFTQLNYVISCVITTCLGDKRMKDTDRAKVVEHWIQVAMVCCRMGSGSLSSPFSLSGCGL
jgi:hypothetical protein